MRKTALPKRILALGAQWKNTFALGSGHHVFLSHHVGDLEELLAYEAFVRDIRLYEELFELRPDFLVHDLHPDYTSTRYAVERAEREGIPRMAVQHHHAHVASAMAENEARGPVIGVAFDGTGFGADGTTWGGEILVADETRFERAGHLFQAPLPGGDRAAREPWRMAVSYLLASEVDPSVVVAEPGVERVVEMVRKNLNSPLTSSAGRLFDAVASLLGVRQKTTYEGQAAMELEWLCEGRGSTFSYPYTLVDEGEGFWVDTRPLVRAVVEAKKAGEERPEIARRFHHTMSSLIVDCCLRLRELRGLERVALSGGVFQNVLLIETVVPALEEQGFEVFRHRKVPANDGGIALGQLAVAGGLLSCA
jgi:hydrogenase maturation protein HypF